MKISLAQQLRVTVNIRTLSDLHGPAAGRQAHDVGSERPPEELLGAGEPAAGSQPAAGGSDSQLGHQERLAFPGLDQTGADCQGTSCSGQMIKKNMCDVVQHYYYYRAHGEFAQNGSRSNKCSKNTAYCVV